jgi:RNA polymerase sigma-70 factor (ECF subfamily)
LELAKNGDIEAFDELIARHQEHVFRLAYRMLSSYEDAADVQQETFIRAWQSLKQFRQDSTFSTWLHRITLNLCISRKRIKIIEEPFFDEEVHSTSASPVVCLERNETAAQVRRILAGIPSHHRALIVLRDIEERPFDEIAQILGCSIESARMRICKARQLFRERLKPFLTEENR